MIPSKNVGFATEGIGDYLSSVLKTGDGVDSSIQVKNGSFVRGPNKRMSFWEWSRRRASGQNTEAKVRRRKTGLTFSIRKTLRLSELGES